MGVIVDFPYRNSARANAVRQVSRGCISGAVAAAVETQDAALVIEGMIRGVLEVVIRNGDSHLIPSTADNLRAAAAFLEGLGGK